MKRHGFGMAPLAAQGMKQTLNAIGHFAVDEGGVRLAGTRYLRSSDLPEGVKAWREKCAPVFKGN